MAGSVAKAHLAQTVDRGADELIEKLVTETYALLTEPYAPDEFTGGSFIDIISGSSMYDVQVGLDFMEQIRWRIIWRARWFSRVYSMAKQSLRVFNAFVVNTGIPKPITKTMRQATREAAPDDAPPASRAPGGRVLPPSALPQNKTVTVEASGAGADAHSSKKPTKPEPDPIQQIIDELWEDPDNAQVCTHGGLEETLTRRQVDGSLLWAIFIDPETGHCKFRRVDPARLADIICDPQDGVRPLYYRLRPLQTVQDTSAADNMGGYVPGQGVPGSAQATMVNAPAAGTGVEFGVSDVFFRDWENTDPERNPYQSRIESLEGFQQQAVMAHFPINRLGKFGLSELFAGGDFLRAHKRFNENRATITDALRRIALLLTVKGGQQQVSAAQAQLQSSLTSIATGGPTSGWEGNPPAAVGSIFASNAGAELQQFKVETGGQEAAADGEMLLQMYAASVGMATHYFGSSQMHVLAVATAMELPILRYLQAAQKGVSDMLRQLVDFALKEAVRAHRIAGAGVVQKYGYEMVDWGELDPSYDIEMPPLTNTEAAGTITPVVQANQAGLITDEDAAHKVYTTLSVDNVDERLSRWQVWKQTRDQQAHAQAVQLKATAPPKPDEPGPTSERPTTGSTAQTQRARHD
jgi:hypothetical protein